MYKNNKQLFVEKADTIQSFLLAVYQFLKIDYPKFYKMDNLSKLGFLASEVLLKEQNLNFAPEEIGLVLTNANASLDADIKYFQSTKQMASPALFVYTLPNIVMGEICIRNKFKGENSFFVFEDFNADFLVNYVSDLFNNNIYELCICGWIDVVQEDYTAALFLVSNNKAAEALLFTKENMNKLFKSAATK
ncbi:MAG: hypothetical protein ABJB05_04185 [Parafilimonas sp.]